MLGALPGEDLEAWQLGFSYFNFNRAIIEGAVSKLSPKLLTSRALLGAACKISVLIDGRDRLGLWGWREQQVKLSFLSLHLCFRTDFLGLLLIDHRDGQFDNISDHRFNVAADVTHFGKLCCLYLKKRRSS